jgi:hypothetical protein
VLYSNEVIVSEIRLECHEDGKLSQKWIGMLHLEPNNNWIKYTIITEGADKLGVEHWIAAESDTEMKIRNVKTLDDGQNISFEIGLLMEFGGNSCGKWPGSARLS